jgi:L-lysine exporter family protein LysE/ArgO
MTAAYVAGLLLGLALIAPIGAQNVFVVGQGLAVGWPRAACAVIAAGCCDTILIVCGAAGVSGLLNSFPGLRVALLLGGALFLVHLGLRSWRASESLVGFATGDVLSGRQILLRTASVSLLNPHAILDTIGVMGSTISAQPQEQRLWFATGAISASWVWFLFLAVGAAAARRYMTPGRARWFERISGTVMLLFAAILLSELAAELSH